MQLSAATVPGYPICWPPRAHPEPTRGPVDVSTRAPGGVGRIGKYEVLDVIGAGSFAVVYRGYDPFLERLVAIKVGHSNDPRIRTHFRREVETAGRLTHRNITTVYVFGIHRQTPYLVEEYLSGEHLADMISRREPETLAKKLDVLTQIACGLGYAHSRGIIHRDVKPSNIQVLANGRIKIMDFGTAQQVRDESRQTQTGLILGTIAYLAPECLRSQPARIASDIFSFGVLAYELLSFRRPFSGTIPTVIDQMLNAAPVPLTESWPECPPDLATIVHKCLARDPEGRYESCEPLQADLEQIQVVSRMCVQPDRRRDQGA